VFRSLNPSLPLREHTRARARAHQLMIAADVALCDSRPRVQLADVWNAARGHWLIHIVRVLPGS
jgi:hypothetical protein